VYESSENKLIRQMNKQPVQLADIEGRLGKGEGRVTVLWKSALAFCKSNMTPREFFPTLGVAIDGLHIGFWHSGITTVDRCAGDLPLIMATNNQVNPRGRCETIHHALSNATLSYKVYTQVFREIRDPVFRKRVRHFFDSGGRFNAQMGAEKASKHVPVGEDSQQVAISARGSIEDLINHLHPRR